MRLQILLGLIFSNLIWSTHPLMGKIVLEDFTPDQAAWLRYSSALLAFGIYRLFANLRASTKTSPQKMKLSDIAWVTLLGGMAFCFSPLLQLNGLKASNATDNALIIAMEPLITVGLAAVFLKQRVSSSHIVCFVMSMMGFGLLAGLSWNGLQLERSHFIGNLLMLAALLGEAVYSSIAGNLIKTYSSQRIFGAAIFAGVILLTLSVWALSGEGLLVLISTTVSHLHWRSAGALFCLGPLGTTVTYLFWITALRETTVASMALTLFIQPVFGAAWGYLFLNERLTTLQAMGGVLILVAVIGQGLPGLQIFQKSHFTQAPPS
jgi:drug/metabolite transporter (DMT)-like permease